MTRKTLPRAAVFIDLENLVHAERELRDWAGAQRVVEALLDWVGQTADIVLCIASCDRELARKLALPLSERGVRTHVHNGGPDAADAELGRRLQQDVPPSCTIVVIASGDHFFASHAARLREEGIQVQVAGRSGSVSAALYVAATDFRDLTAAVCAA